MCTLYPITTMASTVQHLSNYSVTIYFAIYTSAVHNNYMLKHLLHVVENVSEYIQDKSNLIYRCCTKKIETLSKY